MQDTFLNIVNALKVSADEVLCDVLNTGFKVSNTILANQIEEVSPKRREMIYVLLEIPLREKT